MVSTVPIVPAVEQTWGPSGVQQTQEYGPSGLVTKQIWAPGNTTPIGVTCPIPLFPDITIRTGNNSVVPGRGWSVNRTLDFGKTLIGTAFSGRESVMYQQTTPVWRFDLIYNYMKDQTQAQTPAHPWVGYTEFQAISRLFQWAAGTRGSFYFEDRSDNSRTGQIIATGDGTTAQFTIIRTLDLTGVLTLTEAVGAVNLARPRTLYLNGVAQAASTYGFSGNQLLFLGAPPGAGVAITLDFWFYYICKFSEQRQDYEEFMKNLWRLGKCQFESLLVQC